MSPAIGATLSIPKNPPSDAVPDLKPGTLVRVDWDDHYFEFGVYGRKGLTRVETVGYFVEKTPEYVAVALSKTPEGFAETQYVDRRMLIQVRRVRA